jgi:hypothetical protein
MSTFKDITGQQFGRLTVIERMPPGYRKPKLVFWRCRCVCGNEPVIVYSSLASGYSKSCGCLRKDIYRKNFRTHGMSNTVIFSIWRNMLSRCGNPNVPHYERYGGRGIKVCERWLTFVNFLADMGERPSPEHSLDRINNDGNYEPGNVRWATIGQQAINRRKRSVHKHGKPLLQITIGEETLSVADWSHKTGIDKGTLLSRIRRGWSPERAITHVGTTK